MPESVLTLGTHPYLVTRFTLTMFPSHAGMEVALVITLYIRVSIITTQV